MNDRFKFRIWHIESSTMIYPDRIDFWKNAVGVYWEDRVLKTTVDNKTQFILFHSDDVIVMQSTGLKDFSGKLIYEGDILHHDKLGNIYVKFNFFRSCHSYESVRAVGFDFGADICNDNPVFGENGCVKIIGNIYENKGLLDGK